MCRQLLRAHARETLALPSLLCLRPWRRSSAMKVAALLSRLRPDGARSAALLAAGAAGVLAVGALEG